MVIIFLLVAVSLSTLALVQFRVLHFMDSKNSVQFRCSKKIHQINFQRNSNVDYKYVPFFFSFFLLELHISYKCLILK